MIKVLNIWLYHYKARLHHKRIKETQMLKIAFISMEHRGLIHKSKSVYNTFCNYVMLHIVLTPMCRLPDDFSILA